MISELKHIEQKFISSGQKVCFGKGEIISKQGEPCGFILYIPQHTHLSCNGHEVKIQAGAYLLFKEYFMNQSIQNTITTLEATEAILFKSSIIERLKKSNHLYHLFFIQKLSQQAISQEAKFE